LSSKERGKMGEKPALSPLLLIHEGEKLDREKKTRAYREPGDKRGRKVDVAKEKRETHPEKRKGAGFSVSSRRRGAGPRGKEKTYQGAAGKRGRSLKKT